MANERFAVRCPICSESVYLGKSFGSTVCLPEDPSHVGTFMFEHLMACMGGVQQDTPRALFEIIPESHPDFGNTEGH